MGILTMKSMIIKISVLVSYLAMIIVNFLANLLPINGVTAGQVYDLYPNLFTPASLTFSIWGLIYIFLGSYTIYQLGAFQRGKRKLFDGVGIYFIFSSIANLLWVFSWHYNFILLSLILICLILVFLIKIANLLRKEKFSFNDKLLILFPFSIYFGWISVAVIANVTVFLVSIGWNGFGVAPEIWTMAVLLIGTIIGLFRMFKDKNIAYGLVFVWAYSGILFKHLSYLGFNGQYVGVIYVLIGCIILFLISVSKILFNK
jgi:hypothetical protein